MNHKVKVLGLAVIALLAIYAASASSASAIPLFHAHEAPVRVTGTTDGAAGGSTTHHFFDAAGREITCKDAHFLGESSDKTPEAVTVTATYTECTFGIPNATVNMNGCDYIIHASGTVDIGSIKGRNCTTEPITAEGSVFGIKCHVAVGPQTGLHEVTFNNLQPATTSSWEITVEAHVGGIKYTSTGGGCGKTGTFTDGNYTTGNTIVTGEKPSSGAMIGIWWE